MFLTPWWHNSLSPEFLTPFVLGYHKRFPFSFAEYWFKEEVIVLVTDFQVVSPLSPFTISSLLIGKCLTVVIVFFFYFKQQSHDKIHVETSCKKDLLMSVIVTNIFPSVMHSLWLLFLHPIAHSSLALSFNSLPLIKDVVFLHFPLPSLNLCLSLSPHPSFFLPVPFSLSLSLSLSLSSQCLFLFHWGENTSVPAFSTGRCFWDIAIWSRAIGLNCVVCGFFEQL